LHRGVFAQQLLPWKRNNVLFFIVVGLDIAVNNTNVFSVAMEMQEKKWVPFVPLSSNKIFCSVVKNRKY